MLNSPKQDTRSAFLHIGVPLVVTAVLWLLSPYEVTISQAGAAVILAWVPWSLYQKWKQGDRREIPFFLLITGMFWLSYAFPFFLTSHDISRVDGRHNLSKDLLTDSLYLAVLGVFGLIGGVKIAGCSRWTRATSLEVSSASSRLWYLRFVLIAGILMRVFVQIYAWGPEGQQIITNLETVLPAVTFAIFFRYWLRGKCSDLDRFLVLAYVTATLALDISSGWLGSIVQLALICAGIYVYERRKLPVAAALLMLPLILFLQPAKNEFRARFWQSDPSAGHLERIGFWVNNSIQRWEAAIAEPTDAAIRGLAENTLRRFSLLQPTANVMELTPEVVPYQHGRLYSYILITLIPRFAWPAKPSMSDATNWYQVSYRLTPRNAVERVSLAVGMTAESYINFGWLGPLLVMIPVGVFLEMFNRLFLRYNSGFFLNSLGVVLLPGFIGIESQLASYVAGVAQRVAIAVVVLMPALEFSRQRDLRTWSIPRVVPPVLARKDSRPS